MKDPRYWILDPRGHREALDEHYSGRDGEMVDTAFGPARLMVTPSPPVDEWVCDFCNAPILVRWGDEPFPVAMFGSYALCLDHINEVIASWTHDDPHTGESTDIPMGEWPERGCGCEPCLRQFAAWAPYLDPIYATW